MTSGPPFERYPGPPPGSGDVYRVISPYRDALALVSVSGRVSLVQFLLRESDGWRTVVDAHGEVNEGEGSRWSLVHRDPVEVVLETRLPNGEIATASISVSRDGCGVRIRPALAFGELDKLVVEAGEWFHIRTD